ncbi:UPF0481 protein At3g47200-like [Andrographis paniculata]|uniref:UPF0481 protein At3g47200-like n=1 Tax=Andrographis paniculata TaxID=175694 RepID=UPI0021E83F1E|nr:UPF0481 protein At3g47200-like [Andrographis paniculata]
MSQEIMPSMADSPDDPTTAVATELQPPLQSHHDAAPDVENPPPVEAERIQQSDTDDKFSRIYKVTPYMRSHSLNNGQVYDPAVLSLGPYHHSKPHLRPMEKHKEKTLQYFFKVSMRWDENKDRKFFHDEIKSNIERIKNSYEEVPFGNDELAEIILRDACFLIDFIHSFTIGGAVYLFASDYGMAAGVLMQRDLFMLENQIPFWLVILLLESRHGKDKADKILSEYLSLICHQIDGKTNIRSLPWKDDDGNGRCRLPVHLLEATRQILLKREEKVDTKSCFLTKILGSCCKRIINWSWTTKSAAPAPAPAPDADSESSRSSSSMENEQFLELLNFPCRSVTYLQTKGIYFRPSSQGLLDIRFVSYHVYGVLHLPILVVNRDTKVFFSNMAAFEMSPHNLTDGEFLSYLNFMKPLMETAKDVKELRERGILFSSLGSDEEVVNVFKEIDTYGADNYKDFLEVKSAISKHCRSKGKTWMADLAHTYCRSPWAAIAVFAGVFVLCLTFLQTFYTIHPVE